MITTIVAFILAYAVFWPLTRALASQFAVWRTVAGWDTIRRILGAHGLWSLLEVAILQGIMYATLMIIAIVTGAGILTLFSRQYCLWYLVGLHALKTLLALRHLRGRPSCPNPIAVFLGGSVGLAAGGFFSVLLYT